MEAAAFTRHGTVLLGLRSPVTVDGEPVLVELAGVPEMFTRAAAGHGAGRAYALTGVTPPGALVGFRAITPTATAGTRRWSGRSTRWARGRCCSTTIRPVGEVTSRHVRFRLTGARRATGGGSSGSWWRTWRRSTTSRGWRSWTDESFYVTDEDHRVALWVG